MPAADTDMTALRIEADVRLRAGQITETQARGIVRGGRVDPLAVLVAQQSLHTNNLAAALRELHNICLAMDAEDQAKRPTEAEYQAAMREAERQLAKH